MRVRTLEDLRKIAPPEKQRLSDEELVIDFALVTGNDPQEVAEYMGLSTGRKSSSFGAGVGMGVDQVQAMLAGTGAAIAEGVGATDLRDRLEAEVKAQQAQSYLARNPETPQRIEDVSSIGEFGSYAAGQVGQQVPIMGGILAAGAVTGGLGLGAGAGAVGAGYTYGVGSLYNESVEGGQRNAAGALLGGIPYAAAESLVPLGLGRIARGAVGTNLLTATTRKGAIGQATAAGVVGEAATEAFQTELELGMRDDLSAEEVASRRLNAVVAGGLVGGGFSGAAGAFAKLPDPNVDQEGNDLTSDTSAEVGNELDQETFAAEVAARRRQRQEAARRKIEGSLERDPFEPIPADATPRERQQILEARVQAREQRIADAAAQAQADAQKAAELNQQLRELEQLGASKLPQSEVDAINAEMKLAQEQLEATRQGFSSAQELAQAEARLNELEAEITAPVPKGQSARQFKQQQRARAAETLEERTALEATIDMLKQQQFAENQGNAEQALLYELHLEKLQEQLDADAEARFARRAMRRIRGRGIKPSEMTAEQVAEVQADIDSRVADREASLSGELTPVEPTSPIVEPEAEVVAEAEPAPQVAPVEPVSPVVEPTEELVSAEDIEAAEIADSEKESQKAAPELKASVRSEGRKAKGKLTMSQPLIAAAARHLRAITPNGFKKVYEQGGAVIDQAATDEASEFLDQVRAAYHEVVRLSDTVANLVPNVSGFKLNVDEFNFDPDNTEDYEGIRQIADYENLLSARAELKQAVNNFVDLVGGETNANAINAVMKKLKENKYSADSKGIRNKMEFAREVFGRDKEGQLRKGVDKLTSKGDFTKQTDIAFSTALRSYINGELDESFDIAPKGREVRPNLKNQARFQKAEDKGVKLSSEKLEDAATEGRLSYGRKASDLPKNLANAQNRYDQRVETIEQRLAEGEISQKQADSQLATAERDLKKAEASFEKQTAELEQSKGLEALVARALDAADPTLTGKLLRKSIATILRKIPKDKQPTFSFEKVEESSYDPKKGDGGHITFRKEVSPEEVAHEVLHSLLQGIVYRNRKAGIKSADSDAIVETVEVLRGYVNQLIAIDLDKVNLDAQSKQKASEVIGKLRELVNRGDSMGEVDAILELISYGNTMRDFKLLLNQLPKTRNSATANWKVVVRGIWEQIRRLLNLALGNDITDRASNDILDASIKLLSEVSEDVTRARPEKRLSSTLKQSVRSDSVPLDGTANPAEFNIDLRNEVAGKDWALSSKVIFDLLGWDKRMKWGGEKLSSLNTYVKKNLPWVETFVRGWEPTYGDKTLARMIDFLKSDKHNGYLRAEVFADIIMRSDKKLVQDMFAYLDGDKQALEGNPSRAQYEELLDSLQDFLNTYIESLPQKERDKFTARPLSESLLFVETKKDIGSQSLGKMRKISRILSRKREVEDNIEEQLMFDEDGVLNTQDAIYVRAVKYDKDGKEVDKVYARADIAEKTGNVITFQNRNGDLSQYVVADPDARYKVAYTTDNKRYVFTTNMSAGQLLRGEARREDRERLANALRNTVATLANSYASGQFIDALVASGRKADGSFDTSESAEPVYVFDSADELNAYSDEMAKVDGYVPKIYSDQEIPTVAGEETSESRVADALRVTGSYVRFPDNDVIWGELAGKIVAGPVYSAMHDATNKENIFKGDLARKYNTTVRWFKKSKTIYNPSTIVTNVASNVTLMLAHDIRPSTVAKAAKLLKRYYVDKDLKGADLELMSAFMNSGALLGNFSSQEVKESISQAFAANMYEDKAGVQGIVAQLFGLEKAKAQAYNKHIGNMKDKAAAFDDAAIGFYAYGDNIFRMAAFMNYVGRLQADNNGEQVSKAQLKEAGIAARKMFLDYDIDSRYLQGLRQTIVPFASWTYAIMPVLSKIIVTQPWKLVNILGGYAMIDTVASALVGDDDDETRKRMGELYNERLFGIGPHAMIRVPFFGDEQNPVYVKLGNYIPLHSTFKGTPNGTFGIEGWPSGLAPTGPIISAVSMVLNKDSYTGKEIWGSTDSAYDRMVKFGNQVTDIVLPPIAASSARKKYSEALDGKTGITGGRNPSTDPTMVALQAFGLKLYQPNVAEEAKWKQLAAKQAMREYKTAMSRARREMARSGTYDTEALSAELERLREGMMEEIDEVFGRD